MQECPFCKGPIDDELSRFGGHCPKCLIEIPGDEAPTDPGVMALKQKEEVHRASRRVFRSRMVLAAVVVLAVGGGVAWKYGAPEPVVKTVDRDFHMVPLSKHQDAVLPEGSLGMVPTPEAERAPQVVASQRDLRNPSTGDRVSRRKRNVADASVLPKAGGSTLSVNSPLDAFSVGTGPRERGPKAIVLRDAGAIENMVRRGLDSGGRQLRQCFEARLKTDPNLRGAWLVQFQLGTDGKPGGVSVRGQGSQDAELESCMNRNVKNWRFQAINEAISISKTYRFGTGL